MKHSFDVTLMLIGLFFAAQVIGLVVVSQYIGERHVTETGEINITWEPLPSIGGVEMERPHVEPRDAILMIAFAIIIGTVLLLFLAKLKHDYIWKLWFFLAVFLCLWIALKPFIGAGAAFAVSAVLAYLKLFRPGFVVHNFTELFIYGGLAAIFVPIIDKISAFLLLVLISIYDMYAVWKSGHMIKLAKFQTKAKVFAGMLIPYDMMKKAKKHAAKKTATSRVKSAILGGGDVGFPLIFAGVIMKYMGFWKAMVIPVFVTFALFLLLIYGKKDRFYPAMPFLSLGCLAGYAVVALAEIAFALF